ncbi:hypothetical protein ACEPAF_2750 [Sanghuangporus sanghuang]
MDVPHTILGDLFADIEDVYPDFDRKKYSASSAQINQVPTRFAQSNMMIWILSAYKFLTRAVSLEIGDGWSGNTSEDLLIVRSKGFLRFLAERIYSPKLFETKTNPCRNIMDTINSARGDGFSMLRAPHSNLFKSAMINFENLSRRTKVLDYARIIDRHLEILYLTGDPSKQRVVRNLENAIDMAQDILTDKAVGLTGREKQELERLIYNAARNQGLLPSSFYVRDVKKLTDHPFGGGSYGDVYRGKMCDRFVAVKVSRFLWDPETKEKRYRELCKEALIWRPLDHPNVLPFLGICTDGFPSVGLVSPFMDNGELMIYLRRNPGMEQICSGLEHLHNNKPEVIHGDLKCGNILVDDSGRPRIADFGLSRVVDVASLTASTGIKGTLRWQAPELVHPNIYGGDGRVNVKTDIYAYGMTCLEIFLEKTPFQELNDWEVITMARNGSALDRALEITERSHWIHPILECCCPAEADYRFRAEDVIMNVFWSPLYLEIRAGPV